MAPARGASTIRGVLAWLLFPLLGAASGFLAGLLGVGGGIVVVPGLLQVFVAAGVAPEHRLRLALGTSLAAICFTALSSLRAHHARGAVDWGIVRRITPGIVAGTLAGTWVAAFLPERGLEIFYACFLAAVCVRMLGERRTEARRPLPGPTGLAAAGAGIGLLSGLVGIGGGSLSVPYLVRSGVVIHRAVGTSAAIGAPIAISGAAGYVVHGLGAQGLPGYSVGYVHLPALLGVALVSVCFAPIGAALAHRTSVRRLRRWFAAFLLVVAARMVLLQFGGAGA